LSQLLLLRFLFLVSSQSLLSSSICSSLLHDWQREKLVVARIKGGVMILCRERDRCGDEE
jgi:hypothetical protein